MLDEDKNFGGSLVLDRFENLMKSRIKRSIIVLSLFKRKWFIIRQCKWFEPRSISSSYCLIVRLSVVLKRTVNVVGD